MTLAFGVTHIGYTMLDRLESVNRDVRGIGYLISNFLGVLDKRM